MSLLHSETREVLKSELELFTLPPTQTSIEETRFVKYYPLTSLDRGGPLEFNIPSSDKEYIDPQKVFLYMKIRILDENGAQLKERTSNDDATVPTKSIVFPINYFHATCFKSVEVHLNNKSCSNNDTLYPYRAYLETLLSYSRSSKEEQMKAAMWYKDIDPFDEHSDAVSKNTGDRSQNSGALSRFLRTRFSHPFETFGRLHSEIFNQPKLLIGNVDLNIKLQRANNNFSLMAQGENQRYNVSIETAELFVCHKKISDSIREAHLLSLQHNTIKYPVRKVDMKFFTRGANRSDLSEPNLVNGTLPRRIVLGLVNSDAFNGSFHHSPFNFQSFNVSSIAIRKNGENVPFQELEMDYENMCYMQGYMTMLEGTNVMFKDRNIDIQPFVNYPYGYALYAFDLTQDHTEGGNFNLIQQGNISIDIKLMKPSEHGITIVCYLEYDALIEIDRDFNVSYE